jgi:hypothetical protein
MGLAISVCYNNQKRNRLKQLESNQQTIFICFVFNKREFIKTKIVITLFECGLIIMFFENSTYCYEIKTVLGCFSLESLKMQTQVLFLFFYFSVFSIFMLFLALSLPLDMFKP